MPRKNEFNVNILIAFIFQAINLPWIKNKRSFFRIIKKLMTVCVFMYLGFTVCALKQIKCSLNSSLMSSPYSTIFWFSLYFKEYLKIFVLEINLKGTDSLLSVIGSNINSVKASVINVWRLKFLLNILLILGYLFCKCQLAFEIYQI